jgi:hypothetical protein
MMNNPAVEKLYYTLETSSDLSFDNPPPLQDEFELFRLRLDKNSLVIDMKSDLPTETEARAVVEPILKAWELDSFLNGGHKSFWFKFLKSQIVDRDPILQSGSKVLHVQTGRLTLTGGTVTIHITKRSYPNPSHTLCYSADVKSLEKRYEGYLKGREPLLSMTYFCLSLLVSTAGDRKLASKKYQIEEKVLRCLGNLTSTHGDKNEARKIDGNSSGRPLTSVQTEWILAAVRLIIRRKAEYDFDPNNKRPLITMSMLPTLE